MYHMEKFTMESNKNNNEKESEFLSLEFYKKAVKRLTLASALFLASFGVSEAQQKTCSTHRISISNEEAGSIEKKTHEIDSLSDLLFTKAKDHNLVEATKTASQLKMEGDSTDHLYYKSKNSEDPLVLYKKINNYAHPKFIYNDKKLYILNGRQLDVGDYNDTNTNKKYDYGDPGKGRYMQFKKNQNELEKKVTSVNGFETEELSKSLENLSKRLEEEIKLVEGM